MRVSSIAIISILKLSQVVASQHDNVEFRTPHRKRSQANDRKSQNNHQRSLQVERATDEEWEQFLGLETVSSETKQVDGEDGSMSMSPTTTCSFCTNGLSDPTFVLPTDDGASCEDAQTFAATLSEEEAACSTVQMAELFCCPITVATAVEEAVNEALTDAGEEPISILDTLTNNGASAEEEEKPSITSILDTLTNSGGVPLEPGPVILPPEEAPPVACTLELFVCPDGSTVGREGPDCDFPECPKASQVDGQCSCSPLEYNFILDLDSSCDTDELDDNAGIGLTFCFLGVTSDLSGNDGTVRLDDNRDEENVRRRRHLGNEDQRILSTIVKEQKIIFEDTGTPLTQSEQQQMRFLAEEIEIISIQFLEFDTSGELIVINQDDSYSNVTLENVAEVSFKSISNNLDSNVPMEDQLDFLPGGVQVTLRGRVTNDVTGDSRIVSNRITWSYTNACDVQPLESGESIGWSTTGELTPASPDFCPAVIPPPETTTTTEVPPPETTEAPPATTEAPKPTDGPDPSPMFSKSSKSKSGKAKTKKPHPMAKTEKPQDPMAKMVSQVDMDSKSGKAKGDKDAKANKGCGTTPSGKSGKSGCCTTPYGKSGKSGCGKSGKSGTRLFPKAHKMSMP